MWQPILSADMELVTSRKNPLIRLLRELGRDKNARAKEGLFLCDGEKLLREALSNGAAVRTVVYRQGREGIPPAGAEALAASDEVFAFASPLVNSPGPLFTVAMEKDTSEAAPKNAVILENVQDPGNVGTVLRTAAAMGIGAVILVGECADPYNPKTVRGAMGALLRQRLLQLDREGLVQKLREWGLTLYGAALADDSVDVRGVSLVGAAVAVGNEGSGLSGELLSACDKKILIPMTPGSESLNAAVAASILMWEMAGNRL